MKRENGTPVVTPFDFSQDKWQADVKHLDAAQRSLFLNALELECPDLRWVDGDKLGFDFIPSLDFLCVSVYQVRRIAESSEIETRSRATKAQVTLFISEYMNKVEKMEKELHPVGVIHEDGCCRLMEMGVKPPSLHVPGAKDDKKSSGSKYFREIRDIKGRLCHVKQSGEFVPAVIDVYCVLDSFDVRKPALQHANKKTLCAGIRGKGSMLQDLKEARDALTRQIDELENGDVNA